MFDLASLSSLRSFSRADRVERMRSAVVTYSEGSYCSDSLCSSSPKYSCSSSSICSYLSFFKLYLYDLTEVVLEFKPVFTPAVSAPGPNFAEL